MVSPEVERIAGGEDLRREQIGHRLYAETAGENDDVLRPFRDQGRELFLRLEFVAEEVDAGGTRNRFSLFLRDLQEFFAVRLFDGLKFLEDLLQAITKR